MNRYTDAMVQYSTDVKVKFDVITFIFDTQNINWGPRTGVKILRWNFRRRMPIAINLTLNIKMLVVKHHKNMFAESNGIGHCNFIGQGVRRRRGDNVMLEYYIISFQDR